MAKKQTKKMSWPVVLIVLAMVVAAVAGFFTAQKLTENDKFELIGDKVVEVEVGGTYQDQGKGAQVISFGVDLSEFVKTENNIDFNTPGQYYIKYTVDNFRFKGIARYRIINVVEVKQ